MMIIIVAELLLKTASKNIVAKKSVHFTQGKVYPGKASLFVSVDIVATIIGSRHVSISMLRQQFLG